MLWGATAQTRAAWSYAARAGFGRGATPRAGRLPSNDGTQVRKWRSVRAGAGGARTREAETTEGRMPVRTIVELQAKPGRRDELRSLIEGIVATEGPRMPGYLGGELYEVLGDPDALVEIADWESAEARDAVMQNPAAAEMMAPMLELLAAPFRATVVSGPV